MRRVLCSTGALLGRPNGRDFRLLRSLAPQLMCDGFEFMLYSSWYDELPELMREVGSLGLEIETLHCEKGLGEYLTRGELDESERRFRINCEVARELGAKLLVLHLWNGVISDSNIESNYASVAGLRELADEYSLELTVENVVCNHADPMTHLDELSRRYPELGFTFDTKMAAFHGQTFALFEPSREHYRRERRIRHLHVNDYGGTYMDWSQLRTLHPGDGNIDFERFFRNLAEWDYCGDFTVEATAFDAGGRVDVERLNRDFEKIRKYAGLLG